MRRLPAILVILAISGSMSFAASRTWTSRNGRFSLEAELCDFQDGKAHLKKSDGKVIAVPLASLSEEDRQYVKRQFPGVEEEQFRPGVEYREWKSKSGKFGTLAEFLGVSEGKVQLRKPDGSEVSVDQKLLSSADQRWIADELRRLREQDAESSAAAKTAGKEPMGELDSQAIPLKLLPLDQSRGRSRARSGGLADYVLRLTEPQHFFLQQGRGDGENDSNFQRIVKKEPKYACPAPFRAVAKLGSGEYAFALDAVRPQTAYNRLYFDLNGNGDLTDDKPVAASGAEGSSVFSRSQFPRVDLKVEVDGATADYAFLLSAMRRQGGQEAYTSASLYGAAVREGEITQGRKRTRVLLVDRNSNGRFDDTFSIRSFSGRIAASAGDLLLVNPNPNDRLSADASMGSDRYYVSKTVCLGGNFYRMEVPPTSDSLKLTPTKLELGYVTNSSPAYRAVLFNDDYGVLTLSGMKDQKVALPAGTWKVASYTIDATAFTGGSRTAVTASFGEDAAAVTVSKGETAKIPFGAPFKASVSASHARGRGVYLSLSIVGAAGERCTSFYVNGSRPPAPRFVIKDKQDKIVRQGAFEYG